MGICWVVVGGGRFIVGSGGCCWVVVGLFWCWCVVVGFFGVVVGGCG